MVSGTTIGICIPTINQAQLLEESLEVLVSQHEHFARIVIIDLWFIPTCSRHNRCSRIRYLVLWRWNHTSDRKFFIGGFGYTYCNSTINLRGERSRRRIVTFQPPPTYPFITAAFKSIVTRIVTNDEHGFDKHIILCPEINVPVARLVHVV